MFAVVEVATRPRPPMAVRQPRDEHMQKRVNKKPVLIASNDWTYQSTKLSGGIFIKVSPRFTCMIVQIAPYYPVLFVNNQQL